LTLFFFLKKLHKILSYQGFYPNLTGLPSGAKSQSLRVLSFVSSTILFLITEFIMNRFNRFIITVLLGLFTSQAFALDFTQATKDTKFIVSDTNNVIRVYLDNFSAMQISAIPLKNSAGTQILFTHMFVASASNGVGDSSDELIKLGQ
jgi:hypothetical protein